MNNALGLIIQREFLSRVKTKAFILTTILAPILLLAVSFLPAALMMLSKNDDITKVYVLDHTGTYAPLLKSSDKYEFVNLKTKEDKLNDKTTALLEITGNLNDNPNSVTFYSEKQQPPGGLISYIDGVLTEAVRRKPYSVLLLDEVEKAHPDVFNVLLQILDDGRLTDSKGRTVDFKNTIIIMTSNLGSADILQHGEKARDEVLQLLKSYFRPEFLNRIDDVVVFHALEAEQVRQIAAILLARLAARLVSKANLSRFWTRSAMVIWPIISRMLPSSTCWAMAMIFSGVQLSICSAAVAIDTSSEPILMLATPSTITAMYSCEGTGCVVRISTCMMPRLRLSTRSIKGITKVAPPRTIR